MKNYPLVSVVIPTHNRKEKLIRLIKSVLNSNYPKGKIEIIVVDDASSDGTYEEVKKIFPKVMIIKNKKEKLPASSRNIGARVSSGDFVLFIDDDNVVDKRMIKYLVECMKKHPEIGICAPLMFYYRSSIIWCAGVRRNMVTSHTTYLFNGKNFNEIQMPEVIESDDFPNCFMVKSEIIRKNSILFDEEDFPMHYEESDFCYRIRKLGFKAACFIKAKIWHDFKRSKITGFETEQRAYFTARNRIIFHKKYSKWYQFFLFILIFNWLLTLYYLVIILLKLEKPVKRKVNILRAYLIGILDGILRISLSKFSRTFINKYYGVL
jgi:hypothetical protein